MATSHNLVKEASAMRNAYQRGHKDGMHDFNRQIENLELINQYKNWVIYVLLGQVVALVVLIALGGN